MENLNLELAISRAVSATALIERAFHDGEGWTISYGPLCVPAQRTVEDSRITFRADFPEHCWLVEPNGIVILSDAKGEMLSVRAIEHPGDGGWTLEWTLKVQNQTVAA